MKFKIFCLVLIIISLLALLAVKKAVAPKLVEAQIPYISQVVSVSQTASSTFERIEWCESRGNSTAKNASSTAEGIYQFLDGTWRYYGEKLWGEHWIEKSKFNPSDSAILAAYAYGLNGTVDWNASKDCWNK